MRGSVGGSEEKTERRPLRGELGGRSVSLAGLAAHLPEIWPAAELEPEHQGAVGHGVHIFALCQEEDTHGNEMFMVVFVMDVLQELDIRLAI